MQPFKIFVVNTCQCQTAMLTLLACAEKIQIDLELHRFGL